MIVNNHPESLHSILKIKKNQNNVLSMFTIFLLFSVEKCGLQL